MKSHNKITIILSCAFIMMTSACAKVAFSPVPEQSSQEVSSPNKTVSTVEVVGFGNKQVDFLLVLDDSNSMLPELKKLAARMSTFISSIEASNIDWQMCLTTTRGTLVGSTMQFGRPLAWSLYSPANGTPNYILKKGTTNLNNIFVSTIDALTIGGGSSGDERAIKAAYESFRSGAPALSSATGCYRPGAAISVIAISDEDERSVGGDPNKVKSNDAPGSYLPLEAEDIPENLQAFSKITFGQDVRFTFSSIIVKPGDLACEKEQDKDTSPSHPGFTYERMSAITDGGVGSICEADYHASLNTFKDKIVNSLSSLNLECEPLNSSLKVFINGLNIGTYKLEKNVLKFTYALVEGTEIHLQYMCSP